MKFFNEKNIKDSTYDDSDIGNLRWKKHIKTVTKILHSISTICQGKVKAPSVRIFLLMAGLEMEEGNETVMMVFFVYGILAACNKYCTAQPIFFPWKIVFGRDDE